MRCEWSPKSNPCWVLQSRLVAVGVHSLAVPDVGHGLRNECWSACVPKCWIGKGTLGIGAIWCSCEKFTLAFSWEWQGELAIHRTTVNCCKSVIATECAAWATALMLFGNVLSWALGAGQIACDAGVG